MDKSTTLPTHSLLNVSDVSQSELSVRDILGRPMPWLKGQKGTERLTKLSLLAFRKRYLGIKGAENILPENDAFILAANHSQRPEALLLPAILMYCREGKHVHFMADWNFALIPGVSAFYKAGGVVLVNRKPARPAPLNLFRPLFTDGRGPLDQAEDLLREGRSVGIFPEGTANRDPRNLLKGFSGAARLSLRTGAPVIPTGIRFPNHSGHGPIQDDEPMEIEFGRPMTPSGASEKPHFRDVKNWHEQIMREISNLSGKAWQPRSGRRKQCP